MNQAGLIRTSQMRIPDTVAFHLVNGVARQESVWKSNQFQTRIRYIFSHICREAC